MLGGGTFTSMNKVLSGAYINCVSAKKATVQLNERGTGVLPISLKWGAPVTVIESAEFGKKCMSLFGYPIDSEEIKPFREFFKHGSKLIVCNLNDGAKAASTISTAKCSGTRGNDLKHVVSSNVDDETKYDVSTYMGTSLVDQQTVANISGLVSNDYVDFKSSATLSVSAGITFSGGTNATVTGTQHQNALDTMESYDFETIGCMSTDATTKGLYAAYVERMRDEMGIKINLVVYDKSDDYIGTINLKNKVLDTDAEDYALVPWMVGSECGCAVNKSCENMIYDGEYEVDTNHTQLELKESIENGEILFHKNGEDVCVLADINSFVSFTDEMPKDFSLNQTIRVLDEVALKQASTFNSNYVGKVQNDTEGRTSFWDASCDICKQLQKIHAIEDFVTDDVVVEKGDNKGDVILASRIQPTCAMSKLYSTIYVL